jgi:hypothetical protein
MYLLFRHEIVVLSPGQVKRNGESCESKKDRVRVLMGVVHCREMEINVFHHARLFRIPCDPLLQGSLETRIA